MKFFLILCVTLFLPVSGWAQTNLTITVGDPREAAAGISMERRAHLNTMVLAVYQKRLEAAGMRGSQIKHQGANLHLSIPRKWERAFIDAIVHAPGRLEIRALAPMDVDWVQGASRLPEGLEIRGSNEPYLWSASRSLLDRIASESSNESVQVVVSGDEGGWRTYTGSTVLGVEGDIVQSRRDRSPNGGYFVSIRFRSTMVDRLATPGFLDVKTWLVILDGEVLGLVSSASLATGTIEISAPSSLSVERQRLWVNQVAGRLAAPLPIPVAILPE